MSRAATAFACAAMLASPAGAQIVESVGSRAQGMGGAFVAVANDSSATWWNPAGLADGPFLDLALARAITEITGGPSARRERLSWLALGTPPVGISYYRFRITDIQPSSPTGMPTGNREDGGAGAPVRSLAASHVGLTLLHSIVQGIHAGTTVRLVRGTWRTEQQDGGLSAAALLDRGAALVGGSTEQHIDIDVGVLALAGPVRIGGVARNLRAPTFGAGAVTVPRQFRIGAAFDAAKAGGPPLMIAVDADLKAYALPSGERRVVAIGGEQWLLKGRLGIRAGARFNRTGAEERSATAGVSVSLRSGMYLDGHVVRGGAADERGWGTAARVSF
ncbi:MAG: hypothetical protein EXQ59_02265 [Acidobacteria bacterium]|nr:hypothetical protein [Acidobacteriota bacterium]